MKDMYEKVKSFVYNQGRCFVITALIGTGVLSAVAGLDRGLDRRTIDDFVKTAPIWHHESGDLPKGELMPPDFNPRYELDTTIMEGEVNNVLHVNLEGVRTGREMEFVLDPITGAVKKFTMQAIEERYTESPTRLLPGDKPIIYSKDFRNGKTRTDKDVLLYGRYNLKKFYEDLEIAKTYTKYEYSPNAVVRVLLSQIGR